MDLSKCLNYDFSNMNDKDLDELIIKAKEAKDRRLESRKLELWNNVQQAVDNYIRNFGMIKVCTEYDTFTLDTDSFNSPGEIYPLD